MANERHDVDKALLTMLRSEACNLQRNRFTCIGLNISQGPDGKKLIFPPAWQKAKNETCLEQYITEGNNALAIVTGDASDLIVVDVDRVKTSEAGGPRADGMRVMDDLAAKHGLPLHTPIQVTGSGGNHLFFSLSKSLEAGLTCAQNQTKLQVDGRETTIDVRADRGCVICHPTKYLSDGVMRSYEWRTPLCSRDDLQAMPVWLIDILNQRSPTSEPPTKRRRTVSGAIVPHVDVSGWYYDCVKGRVQSEQGDIGRHWTRDAGFDFSPQDRSQRCTCCGQIHSRNNYRVRRIISTCFHMSNYSNSCCTKVFDAQEVQALVQLGYAPTSDDRFVAILKMVTADDGHVLSYTGKQWMCFQGLYWETLSDIEIKRRIKMEVNYDVLETLLRIISSEKNQVANATLKNFAVDLRKAHLHLMKAGNVNSVADSAKQLLLDETLTAKLDTNKDILACADGVIDLPSGTLRGATPQDYVSRYVPASFLRVDEATPDIDAFFASIFNDDAQVVAYVQRLLGYGITGHTREQVWCLFTGVGSNGKSVLLNNLRSLLGPEVYLTPPKEVFFQAGRTASAGAHTAHLVPLRGKLFIAREEVNEIDRLDASLIKDMTGEGSITTRAPYSAEWVTFQPTHLAILACNHLPAIDIDDEAMLRRLVVVPFTNVYAGPSDRVPYDPTNPRHRLKDPNLRDKLQQPHVQRQFLTWLVRGAVQWYRQGLGDRPTVLREALSEYIFDNDTIAQFITEKCDTGKNLTVNAAALKNAYIEVTGHKMKQKEFQKAMAKRGFSYKVAKINGVSQNIYRGLTFRCQ